MAKSRAVSDVEFNESHYVLKNLSQLIIPLNSNIQLQKTLTAPIVGTFHTT